MGAALLALILLVAARLLSGGVGHQGVFPNSTSLKLCINKTGSVKFDMNVRGYKAMYVSVLGGGHGLSVSYPLPGPPRPFVVEVRALEAGNYTLTVEVTLVGEKTVTKEFKLLVVVVKCPLTSS